MTNDTDKYGAVHRGIHEVTDTPGPGHLRHQQLLRNSVISGSLIGPSFLGDLDTGWATRTNRLRDAQTRSQALCCSLFQRFQTKGIQKTDKDFFDENIISTGPRPKRLFYSQLSTIQKNSKYKVKYYYIYAKESFKFCTILNKILNCVISKRHYQ